MKPLMLILYTGMVFVFLTLNELTAQNGNISADTITSEKTPDTSSFHSPKRAAMMSAIFPGLGQIYNKKYWKVPIIYGGFIALGYGIGSTQALYSDFREEYILRVTGKSSANSVYEDLTASQLADYRDSYRKIRDQLVIGTAGLYLIQIIDASVDAHLFSFDVSEDLSFDLRPDVICMNAKQTFPVLSLRIKL